jgi:hypothetical protein
LNRSQIATGSQKHRDPRFPPFAWQLFPIKLILWCSGKQARALLSDPEITVEDIARRFGVGPSTLYRYLPAARQAAQDEA